MQRPSPIRSANATAVKTAALGCLPTPASHQNLAGAPLPNAPKNKVTLGANYRADLFGSLEADFNLNSVWQSAENFAITRDPGTIQAAYGITNLNISFTGQKDKQFTVALFVNNLFDKHYATNIGNVRSNWSNYAAAPAGTFYAAYTRNVPRDNDRFFGVRLAISGG